MTDGTRCLPPPPPPLTPYYYYYYCYCYYYYHTHTMTLSKLLMVEVWLLLPFAASLEPRPACVAHTLLWLWDCLSSMNCFYLCPVIITRTRRCGMTFAPSPPEFGPNSVYHGWLASVAVYMYVSCPVHHSVVEYVYIAEKLPNYK